MSAGQQHGARPRSPRRLRRTAASALAALAVLVATVACSPDADEPAGPDPSPDQTPASLSFGISSSDAEAQAWRAVAADFDDDAGTTVDTTRLPTETGALVEKAEAGELPDVFLADRNEIASLVDGELVQPVDELLDERGVDFGDGYSRDAVQALSSDNRLQCMPIGISPVVVYYNTDLVDFDRMAARGIEGAQSTDGWNLAQISSSAQFATRPARGTRGIHVDPTLRGFSPWVYAAEGQVYDDIGDPVSTAFSSEETQSALETFLPLLRDRSLTLTDEQLERRSGVEWFEAGRLGMITGTRSLVPRLRQADGLSFDVMPIPFLGQNATIGDVTGICISADAADPGLAADFLVHALSPESLGRVARKGELVPANLEVSVSDDFVQPSRQPRSSNVFTESVRDIVLPPLLDTTDELAEAVNPSLEQMVREPVLTPEDLQTLGVEADLASREVLTPGDVDADGIPDSEDDEDDSGLELPSESPDPLG
ncbi:extracellular solute-binding protein [Nocardioides sp. CFH 31398]|uniref:extracellular solute-binding protein n=1 Tax=Nocardioides sp. CFH 31398 TaxID=2919579 RepID=UPI001F06A572|nr:extracellular solute-binding protein [Nocardioides sp. CFH 31398]MCH1867634.1 extracellular solute-binding protein [Nocardioides sp. CFH 31398]